MLTTIFETATATQTELTISSAAGETIITTRDLTYTTQLPAQTSYATQAVGTQTVVVSSGIRAVESNA